MSHIFDTLRRIEGERSGVDTRVPSEAVDLLGLAERKFPPQSETTFKAPNHDASHPAGIQEQRLRVVGSPLSVGRTPVSVSAPVTTVEPQLPAAIPAALPVQLVAAAPVVPEQVASAVPLISTAAPIWTPPHPFELRRQVASVEVPAQEIPPQEAPRQEAQPQEPERLEIPGQEAPHQEVPQQVFVAKEVPAPIQKELSAAKPADEYQIKLPAGVVRTVSVIRTAMPLVRRLLPLLEGKVSGNIGSVLSSLLAPPAPEPVAALPVQLVELTPIENGLADLKVLQNELGDQVVEHGESLKRIDYQLELMRDSTDRNTLEQQELIEELKDVGKKVNFVVLIALSLLGIEVVLNTVLYLHIVKILR